MLYHYLPIFPIISVIKNILNKRYDFWLKLWLKNSADEQHKLIGTDRTYISFLSIRRRTISADADILN